MPVNSTCQTLSRHASELSELKARSKQGLDEQEVVLRTQFQKQYDQVSSFGAFQGVFYFQKRWIFLLQVKQEAERDKKEAAEQEKLFQLERFRKQAEQMESFHRAEVGKLLLPLLLLLLLLLGG